MDRSSVVHLPSVPLNVETHTSPPTPEKPVRRQSTGMADILKKFVLSWRFFIPLCLLLGLAGCWFASLYISRNAAETSIHTLENDFQNSLVELAANMYTLKLTMAEHIGQINKKYFKTGVLEIDDKPEFLSLIHDQLSVWVEDTCSSMSVTTKEGNLLGHGYYFPPGVEPYSVLWYSWDTVYEEWLTDADGRPLTMDYRDNNTNDTTGLWYTIVNQSAPASGAWTPCYMWYDSWFISYSTGLYDTAGNFLGVTSVDMLLNFMDKIAQKIVGLTTTVSMELFVVEQNTGFVISSSYTNLSLSTTDSITGETRGVYPNEASKASIRAVDAFVRSQVRANSATPPNEVYAAVPDSGLRGSTVVGGRDMLVNAKLIDHGGNRWLLFSLLDQDRLLDDFYRHQLISIVVSIVLFCLASVMVMIFMFKVFAMSMSRTALISVVADMDRKIQSLTAQLDAIQQENKIMKLHKEMIRLCRPLPPSATMGSTQDADNLAEKQLALDVFYAYFPKYFSPRKGAGVGSPASVSASASLMGKGLRKVTSAQLMAYGRLFDSVSETQPRNSDTASPGSRPRPIPAGQAGGSPSTPVGSRAKPVPPINHRKPTDVELMPCLIPEGPSLRHQVFNDFIPNPVACEILKDIFCNRQCHEQLQFLLEAHEYTKLISFDDRKRLAQSIYKRYFDEHALSQINVSHEMIGHVKTAIAKGDYTTILFDEPITEMSQLVFCNLPQGFEYSAAYDACVMVTLLTKQTGVTV